MNPLATSSETAGFKEVEHTADWAYQVWGKSLEELFREAAYGLYSLAGMQLANESSIHSKIQLQGIDQESLLIAWLNELLYLYENANLGCDRLEFLRLDERCLVADLLCLPITTWTKEIKAVTYHNLAIRETETGLEVTIILDV